MSGGGLGAQAWERHGECSLCARCCTQLRIQCAPHYYDDPDVRAWVELHGIKVLRVTEDGYAATFVMIPMACLALGSNGSCTIHGKPERPQLCHEYPVNPGSLLGVEEWCSFSFTPKRKESADGLREGREVPAPGEGAGRADGRQASASHDHETRAHAEAREVGSRA